MTDPFAERTLVIGPVQMTFQNINALEESINKHCSFLRQLGEDLSGRDPDMLDMIERQLTTLANLIEAHDNWSAEIAEFHSARVEELKSALSALPPPFGD